MIKNHVASRPLDSFETAEPVVVSERRNWSKEPASPRQLPHSLEAEEHLLSCCLLDGGSVVAQCLDARITAASFYEIKHGVVFDCILDCHRRQLALDAAVVTEELKTAKRLDEVGGYGFIAQVSSRIPTTAQASYFIEKVREQALLREIIRSATGTVEDCYGFSGGIDEFLADTKTRFVDLAESRSSTDVILTRLEACRFDPARRLPDMVPVMSLGKVPILTRGNIASLTAVAKAGKSSTTTAILAATFRDPDQGKDCFTFNGLNAEQHAVIHFDTEQHGKDHEFMLDLVLRRAGTTTPPPWLHSYSRKGATTTQLKDELEVILKTKAKLHGGIALVVLDGVADFVNDVNDPKECNPVVAWLESLSVKYNCSILGILHLNPLSSKDSVAKARGHLGSQLQRKGETDLRLKKSEDEVTTLFTDPLGTRRKQVLEKDGPSFKWDTEANMHVSCTATSSPKDEAKAELARDLAQEVFARAQKPSLRFAELSEHLATIAKLTPASAENKVSELRKHKAIEKDMLGFWVLGKR